jgi:membrane protein
LRRRAAELVEIARDILREARDDRITGEAAKAAYYFALSLFPAILALFALTGIFGGHEAFEWIMGWVRQAMPGEAAHYLGRFVAEVTGSSRPGILSLGILLTLWSASTAFAALADALNVMFDLEEERAWWRRRALAMLVLLVSLAALTTASAGLLAGPRAMAGIGIGALWAALRYPAIFVLITVMMFLIYAVLPHRRERMVPSRTVVGAVVGASLWVLATEAFRLFVGRFGRYSHTYGAVGALMLLLIWLYLTALAILFGGEVAATLEQRVRARLGNGAGGEPEGAPADARCNGPEEREGGDHGRDRDDLRRPGGDGPRGRLRGHRPRWPGGERGDAERPRG